MVCNGAPPFICIQSNNLWKNFTFVRPDRLNESKPKCTVVAGYRKGTCGD